MGPIMDIGKRGSNVGENDFLSFGCSATKGGRGEMEDFQTNVIESPVCFFAVYDGHGGARAAEFCSQRLHHYMSAYEGRRVRDTPQTPGRYTDDHIIEESFLACDAEFHKACSVTVSSPMLGYYTGSTCVAACIYKISPTQIQIVVPNVGDSRAVLYQSGTATALSVDHKPDAEGETRRIEAAGKKIFRGRVYAHGYKESNLSLSRAFGDFVYKSPDLLSREHAVCCVPTIQRAVVTRSGGGEGLAFLLLACDGVWDVLTNEAACQFVVERLAEQEAGTDCV